MVESDPCPQCEEGRDANVRCPLCDDRCCEECSQQYEMVVTYVDDETGEEMSTLYSEIVCGFCDPQYHVDKILAHEETIDVVWDWV